MGCHTHALTHNIHCGGTHAQRQCCLLAGKLGAGAALHLLTSATHSRVLARGPCPNPLTEWRVLRMTAIDFGAGRREATFLVECTEGDAMRLR